MNLNQFPLWTALITPLNEDQSVDFESLDLLLKEQNEAQNGILILGSTGESLNLTHLEKTQIIDYTLDQNLEVPIMVGIGGHQLSETRDWIQYLNTKNIDAYLMVTPIYAKPSHKGQYYWFKELLELSKKPVMLYNVPGRTGTSLSKKAVEALSTHPNFWSIKEASGSVEELKDYIKAANGKPVYCGDDGLFFDFAKNGSQGLVSVASNPWPKETHRYVKECLSQSLENIELWQKASHSLFITSNPLPAKTVLQFENRIRSNQVKPPLHIEDMTEVELLKEQNKIIKEWFNQ